MSCTAKLPIYGFFVSAFFPKRGWLIITGLYLLGILIGILMALVFKNTLFRGEAVPFVMELPNYRIPGLKTTMLLLYEKAKDFIVRAFTVIFFASVIIWFLQSFDIRFNVVTDTETSMLASVAKLLAPVFSLQGFGDWRAVTALISGFMAKEAVVSILEVLTSGGVGIRDIFTPAAAYAFLVFTALYTPCVASFAAIRREYGNKAKGVFVALMQSVWAWIVSLVVYRILLLVM
jgi:ferrous iron transport protein B